MPYKDKEKRRELVRAWRAANPDYHKKYNRTNREKIKENRAIYEESNRNKINARQRVNYRVNTISSWPLPSAFKCSDCNAQAVEYHHEDYSLWWSVEPLCKACHGKRHYGREGRG